MTPRVVVYAGELFVEDGLFKLRADRLIRRNENEISFRLSGQDDSGVFILDSVARKTPNGPFVSALTDLIYPGFEDPARARVAFEKVQPSSKGNKCSVVGLWMQNEDSWQFSGELKTNQPFVTIRKRARVKSGRHGKRVGTRRRF